MVTYTYGLLGLVVAVVLYNYAKSALEKRRRRLEAARRGCGPVPVLKNKDPFGLSTFISSLKATKDDRGPQYVVETMDSIGKDVHTVQVRLLDYSLIVTRDPENVKAMFATQCGEFDIGASRQKSWEPLLGVGIFTSTGERWKHSRALVRPQFAREQISDLDLEERHVQDMLNVLTKGKTDPSGWTNNVDLQPLFYNFTLDTATEFLYGHSTHTQNPARRAQLPSLNGMDTPDRAKLSGHLDAGKYWIETRGAFWKWYWLISSKDFDYRCKEIHKFVDWFVQVRLRGQKEKLQPPMQSGSRKKFILLDELAEHTQNPRELRNETLSVLTAGRDTTGALLGWVFYFLARHPRVFDKLRSIILQEFGNNHQTGEISFVKLRSCTYLQYCINEAFRVAAVIPLNERVCNRDTTLPRGGGPDGSQPVFITKGTQVLIATYAMQHRADIWGADVEEFKPERWEGRRVGWEFVPFGAGPRICLGRKSCCSSHNTKVANVICRTILPHRDFVRHCPLPPKVR